MVAGERAIGEAVWMCHASAGAQVAMDVLVDAALKRQDLSGHGRPGPVSDQKRVIVP